MQLTIMGNTGNTSNTGNKNTDSILQHCTCYQVGAMQYENGEEWRNKLTETLSSIPIKCFNPYKKPFIHELSEDNLARESLEWLMQNEKYDQVHEYMKEIRSYDLNLVDRADFIFAYLNPSIPSFGSCEEIYWANRLKKPMFIVIEGGKKLTPLWLMGTIPHSFIYNTIDDAVKDIFAINEGLIDIDLKRWRLLKPEYR